MTSVLNRAALSGGILPRERNVNEFSILSKPGHPGFHLSSMGAPLLLFDAESRLFGA